MERRTTRHRIVLACVIGAALVGAPALADPPAGKGKGKGKPAPEAAGAANGPRGRALDDAALTPLRFTREHERIIRDWFGVEDNLRGLPPGLAKRDRLPPGLEKQLARNGTLPPGLEKKLHPLPRSLASRLPILPDGYRRRILGESILVLDERTSAIVDVLHGVARIAGTL